MVEENVRVKSFCPECGEEFEGDVERCPEDGSRLQEVSLPDDDEEDPLIGEELDDRFLLESILGEGGMGRVYRGTQLSVEREVAVKVLRSELAREETIVKRFFREAKVISSLSHPNIVNLVDFGQDPDEGVLYLAMEYIEGHSLGELLDRGRLKPPLAVDIAMQACGALSDPHEREIVHRDLKPENVMLVRLSDGSLQVKVVDFGIAHTLKQTQKLTQTGTVFGTPFYMAPEQAQGKDVGPHTDIYSLGVILYEMVSGRPPFKGDTSMRVMFQHIKEDPPPLEKVVEPGVLPDRLIRLIRSMLSKREVERPESALDVRKRLQEIRRESGYQPVMLEGGEDVDQFEPWIGERGEVSVPREDTSNPPETGGESSAPDTGEFGRASTLGESETPQRPAASEQVAQQSEGQKAYRGERPNPGATAAEAEPIESTGGLRGSMFWIGIGAGSALLALGLVAGGWYFFWNQKSDGPGAGGEVAASGEADAGGTERADDEGDEVAAVAERNPSGTSDAGAAGRDAGDVSEPSGARAADREDDGPAPGAGGPDRPGTEGGSAGGRDDSSGRPGGAGTDEPAETGGSESTATAGDGSAPEEESAAEEESSAAGEEESAPAEEPSSSSDDSDIATPDFADDEEDSPSSGSESGGGGEGGSDESGSDDGGFYPVE